MENQLTVLIPTIGRESIASVLDEISREDSILVIILAHGKLAYSKTIKFTVPGLVQVIECDENLSLSELCNIGLKEVASKYFGFFSDDDTWLNHKSKKLIEILENNLEISIAIGSTIEKVGKKQRKRPSVLLDNNQNIFEYLYGSSSLLKNRKYLGLQDAIIRSGSYPNFRTNSNVYEDIIWLSDAQLMGHQIICSKEVVSLKFPSMQRSSNRQTESAVLDMYREIVKVNERSASKFFLFHSTKAAIAAGDVKMYRRILKTRYNSIGITLQDIYILPAQIFALTFFWISAAIKKIPI